MDEKMKQFGGKAKDFFSKISKKVWLIILAVVGVLVIGGIMLAVVLLDKNYVPLFRELSSEDMSAILNYLNEQNVTDYKVEGNDTILVPEAMETTLKGRVMMAGYPSNSDHYQLYRETVGALSTESDRRTFSLLDLQERLGSVIETFDNVREAHVFINPGSDNSYILNRDSIINASATVIVETRNGRLTDEVASAIRRAVNHAVEGLTFENVTVEDQDGSPYIDLEGVAATNDASVLKLTLESEQNAIIRKNVLNLLAPVFGEENVSIGVNTTVDVSHTWEELTRYYLPEYAQDGSTGGRGIIGRRVFSGEIQRDDNNPVGGIPGTSTNADITEYVETGDILDGTETGLNVRGETDYRTDQDVTQKESNAGIVIDCMVSVTINAQPGSLNLDDWIAHVARVAGIDVEMQYDKVSVIAAPFYVQPEESDLPSGSFLATLPEWVLYAAIAGLALFLLILIIVLILVSRAKKKRREQEEALRLAQEEAARLAAEQAELEALAAEEEEEEEKTGANIQDIHTERSMELRKEVRAFAENNPEVAAYMIKSWLKGDDDNG